MNTIMERLSPLPDTKSPDQPPRGIEYREHWRPQHGPERLTFLVQLGRVYVETERGVQVMFSNGVEVEEGSYVAADVMMEFPEGFKRAPLSPEDPRVVLIPYNFDKLEIGKPGTELTILDDNGDRASRLRLGKLSRIEFQERQWQGDEVLPRWPGR